MVTQRQEATNDLIPTSPGPSGSRRERLVNVAVKFVRRSTYGLELGAGSCYLASIQRQWLLPGGVGEVVEAVKAEGR